MRGIGMNSSVEYDEKNDKNLEYNRKMAQINESNIFSLLMRLIESYSTGLWSLLGEGAGGVVQTVGKDLWNHTKMRANSRDQEIDLSTPENALDDFIHFLVYNYNVINKAQASFTDDKLEIKVEGCKMHHYTDNLEDKGIPREIGCPGIMVIRNLLRETTNKSYGVENIDSKYGNCNIYLKKR